jgi:uncharacterized membrane protein YdjX (TVP38/TMEM64 family)
MQLSSIPTGRYMMATLTGLMPFQIMWVYLGTTLRSLTDVVTGNIEGASTVQYISLSVNLMAAIALPLYLCYRSYNKPNIEPAVLIEV